MCDPEPPRDAELVQYLRHAHEAQSRFLNSVTVQLLSSDEDGKVMRAWGSGVLFRVLGRSFIVTAEHLLDGRRLWLRSPLLPNPLALRGSRTIGAKEGDVMVIQPSEEASAATAQLGSLTLTDVNLNPAQQVFSITGFPLELNQRVPQSMTAMSYITHRYSGSAAGLRFDGDDRQILLEYALTDSVGADGTDAGLPRHLHGMSGCPVWATTAPDARLSVAGVQTSTIEMPGLLIVKATRWNVVLGMLSGKFPELVPELRALGFDVR